jgi:hypothetical protein
MLPLNILKGSCYQHSDQGFSESGSPPDCSAAAAPIPAVLQVRYLSELGLFKGCLLVTDDVTLCPPGCVVFRDSMHKTKPVSTINIRSVGD